MRRPRGPGGRFLTAEEIAAQKAQQETEAGPCGSASIDGEGEDDDDAMGDLTKDVEMSVDSPAETPKMSEQQPPQSNTQLPDKQREIRQPPVAPGQPPPLQPRPQPALAALQPPTQPQLQAQPPAQLMAQPIPTPQPKPQPSPNPVPQPQRGQLQSPHPPPPAPSPFQLQLGHTAASVNLIGMSFAGMSSHPPTPAPLSPTDGLAPMDHMPTPDPYARTHPHAHPHGHPHTHDHSRTISTAAGMPHAHSHAGQPGQAAHRQPPPPPPPQQQQQQQQGGIGMRQPYHAAAMQMHHVPHPHAHARHHASSINRIERLYGTDHNVVNISAEGIKGDMQRRGSDMMRFGNAPSSK